MGKEPANLIELIKQLKDKGIPEEGYGVYYNRFLEKNNGFYIILVTILHNSPS